LIKTLESPGRNVTGVNHVAPLEVQLNSMLTYKKETKLIAAIYNPDETNSVLQVKALTEEAKKIGITVLDMPVLLGKDKKPDPTSIPDIIKSAHEQDVDFLYTPPDTFMSVNCEAFVEAANMYKIPTFATTDSMYWKGKPLLGMLSRFINVGRFGGFKAYQILVEGKKPQDIPYEKLSRFSYIVSLETAHRIGLDPSIPVLRFAEIIEEKDDHARAG
jgi:putative ABC transport system substrate-binding protein